MAHSKPNLMLALLLLITACPAAGASVMRVHSTGQVEMMQTETDTGLANMFSDDLDAKAVTSKLLTLAKGKPSDELLPFVQQLKKEIQPWHDKSEATLKAAIKEIEACAAEMKNSMDQTKGEKDSCSGKSTSHTTHRTDESTKFIAKEEASADKAEKKEIMTTECNAFQKVEEEAKSATASYGGGDEGAYLESVARQFCKDLLPRYREHKAKCTTTTAEHVTASKIYETKNTAHKVQKTRSDSVQTEMDVTCCEYSLATKDVCTSHDTCHEDKVAAYEAVEAIIKSEEKVKKVEWRVYSRIECLLPVLGTDKAADIEQCRDKTHDTSHLDIEYPDVPQIADCEPDQAFPGTDAYYSTHFGNLPDNAKGKKVAKCTGMMGGAPPQQMAVAKVAWTILTPDTKFGGSWVNWGTPLPVTLKLHLGGDEWMLGLVEAPYLKTVKIRITGETTSEWIATRYDNKYDKACAVQTTFTLACFKGVDPAKDAYPVILRASMEASEKKSVAKCTDIEYTMKDVWNYKGSGVALGKYTNNQLQFIGCVGNGCAASTFYCKDTADGITFGTTQRSAMRACAGVSRMEDCKYNGCCKKAGGLCNSPDKAVDATTLCQQLGYRTGTVEKVADNTCPEAGWMGSQWNSDYVNSGGYGKTYTCSQ